ncbi:MAG TPA: hypothetical protein VLG12_08740 [Candidatus Saccharimonadales bacterium]|nr:hypothetical protein [Candidatus Saccharimonadales bacterium]
MNQENKLQTFLTSPKGLTIMVVCVAVLLAVYLLLSTTTKNAGQTTQNITTTPTQEGETSQSTSTYPTTNPKLVTTDLYFLKNPDNNTVYINVKTGKQPISGLQLVLAYNPSLISNITITPADFFDNPIVLQNSVDANKGIVYYTLAINPNSAQISGEGTVAILHYSGIPTGVSTTLSVLPQTKVTSQGVNDSVLSKTNSITIP